MWQFFVCVQFRQRKLCARDVDMSMIAFSYVMNDDYTPYRTVIKLNVLSTDWCTHFHKYLVNKTAFCLFNEVTQMRNYPIFDYPLDRN